MACKEPWQAVSCPKEVWDLNGFYLVLQVCRQRADVRQLPGIYLAVDPMRAHAQATMVHLCFTVGLENDPSILTGQTYNRLHDMARFLFTQRQGCFLQQFAAVPV